MPRRSGSSPTTILAEVPTAAGAEDPLDGLARVRGIGGRGRSGTRSKSSQR